MTGAGGFLGRHVLEAVEVRGLRAVGLIRDPEAWRRMDWTGHLSRVVPLVGSVTAPDAWSEARPLDGISGILHLAAVVRHTRRGAAEVYRTNVEGTLAMVRVAAARGCRLVLVSTSGTVGCFRSPDQSADEDAPWCESTVARWPYYHSKVQAERRARRLANERGVELVVVRPPVLLGPGDHRFRSTAHLIRYLRGRLPFLVRGGIHFGDIRDAAPALVAASQRPEVRPVYHLCGTACTIERFFALAEEVSGMPRRVIPFRLAWWLATLLRPLSPLPDPVVVELAAHCWRTSSRYAEPELGYQSRDPRETLRDTVVWLRRHHPALEGLAPDERP